MQLAVVLLPWVVRVDCTRFTERERAKRPLSKHFYINSRGAKPKKTRRIAQKQAE